MVRYQVRKKDVIVAIFGGQLDKPRQRAGNGYNAGIGEGSAASAAEQESNAQGLIDHPGKRMGRINGDGGQ